MRYYIANLHSTLTICCFSPSIISKQPISIFEIGLFRMNGVNSVTFRNFLTASKLNGFIDVSDDFYDSARVLDAAGIIRDGVKIQKATDFTSDAKNIIDSLDYADGITKSSAAAGRKIHAGYKTNYLGIEGMKKKLSLAESV